MRVEKYCDSCTGVYEYVSSLEGGDVLVAVEDIGKREKFLIFRL